MEAIRQGTIQATVLQRQRTSPELAVEQASVYIQTVLPGPGKQPVPCELITPENVDEYGIFARLS